MKEFITNLNWWMRGWMAVLLLSEGLIVYSAIGLWNTMRERMKRG